MEIEYHDFDTTYQHSLFELFKVPRDMEKLLHTVWTYCWDSNEPVFTWIETNMRHFRLGIYFSFFIITYSI